nr:hypothetical protein Iba_chr11aCG10530 [Ipomoea batatas]GME17461.1 hypothetical protein Iba_scaffold18860CG0010 [Ipomoea batatas]
MELKRSGEYGSKCSEKPQRSKAKNSQNGRTTKNVNFQLYFILQGLFGFVVVDEVIGYAEGQPPLKKIPLSASLSSFFSDKSFLA